MEQTVVVTTTRPVKTVRENATSVRIGPRESFVRSAKLEVMETLRLF